MLSQLQDWFLTHQIKIAIGLGVISVAILFSLDSRGGLAALGLFLLSSLLIYIGGRAFQPDTSENWLRISYGSLIRNTIGGVSILFGWIILLRGPLAWAIGSLLLRAS